MRDPLITVVLEQVYNLLDRADTVLIPGLVDAPTAKDEVRQARHLLSVLMDCLDNE
jgi:hypothetical protein